MHLVAEGFLLDVGQGTANVVLLGGGRALVIDCGSKSSSHVLTSLLDRHVTTIEALILSHNDEDHIGAAPAVIARYKKAIRRIYHVQERNIQSDRLAKLLRSELNSGNLLEEPRSCDVEDQPRQLFADTKTGIELVAVSPTHWETQEAQFSSKPNSASAVVILKCGTRRIVFAGDSSVDQWRSIHRRRGSPVECDVLAVSHHGGRAWSANANATNELAWLYSHGVRCRDAIISVGTANKFNTQSHPRKECVSSLTASGATVVCTQITPACCDDLEQLRPGIRRPEDISRSKSTEDRTSGGNSRNVACAGTVIAEISDSSIQIRRLDEHQAGIDSLVEKGFKPMCRI